MKQAEAEQLIRSLVREWADLPRHSARTESFPSFSDFWSWMDLRYPAAKKFRSTMGADYMAEMWFDQELGQTWRR